MSPIKILISQEDNPTGKSPYEEIAENFNVEVVFKPFFSTEIIDTRSFRQQRVNIMEYDCVLLRSRKVTDFFFEMVKKMRLEITSSFKYFCYSESVALYLQKYITYRKRRIFIGENSYDNLGEFFEKYSNDRYLVPSSNTGKDVVTRKLDTYGINYTKIVLFEQKNNDLREIDLNDFSIIVFYSPYGVDSFSKNFKNYKSNPKTVIACLGEATKIALENMGLEPKIVAGVSNSPLSITAAISNYLEKKHSKGLLKEE